MHGVLIGCACSGLERISFVLKDMPRNEGDHRESYEFPTRAITYKATFPAGEYGISLWDEGIDQLFIDIDKEKDKTVILTQAFETMEAGLEDWLEMPDNQKGHLAKGLVNISGDVYAFGMVRSIFRRVDTGVWKNITLKEEHPNLYADIEKSKAELIGSWVGFSAMDGFARNDIYAGGNNGDSWHYDGKTWDMLDLPINHDISSITCAPDGNVYVGCKRGPVLCGRGDYWRIIDRLKQINHSAWFQGKIYFSSNNGRIYTYLKQDKELQEANFKKKYPQSLLKDLLLNI